MIDLQTKAINQYNRNIEYLKKSDKDLHDRVIMLSELISSKEYKERYRLEYIKEDEQFDIYDENSQSFLYDKKPTKFIKDAVKNTNLDKVNTIDLLNSTVYNYKHPLIIDNTVHLEKKERALVINDLFEYIEIFKTSTAYKNKIFKYIEKFIFVGTLLGTHIEPIHKKLNCSLYFICEYNLEIFRLSLFTTDYQKIAQKSKLVFSIMEESKAFNLKLDKYFNHAIRSNYMIKYYCSNYNINDYFDKIIAASTLKDPLGYSYQKIIHGLLNPSLSNIKKYPILNTRHNHQLLKDKPVLFIAAGPSLAKHLQWIKKYQNKYIIIAIGASIITLIKNNIYPDIIVSIDADEIIENQFPKDIHDKISNTILLTSTITNHRVLDIFNLNNIILFEAIAAFKQNSLTMYGYSVGEITLNILSILGANDIYMIGTDLSLDPETGSTHIEGHQEYFQHNLDKKDTKLNSIMKDKNFHVEDSTIVVKGNLRENIITTLKLHKSIPSYNRSLDIILSKCKDTNIYNLSDGVYLNGTIPMKVDDVKIINNNKQLSKNNILKYFKKYSEIGFSDKENKNIQNSISIIDKIIKELDIISNTKIKSYDSFLNLQNRLLNIILTDCVKYQIYFMDRLYIGYILTIEPFLGYQFNESIKNEANLIKKVKKIWIKQMLRISNQYKEIINKNIKEGKIES